MSDEERDVDIESDSEKRAHHNALERKRRDHIKESFHSLRDSVPSLSGEKSSRAQILKQATDYIQFMGKKNGSIQQDIEDLRKQNNALEQQVRALEKAKAAGTFAAQSSPSKAASSSSSASSSDMRKNYDGASESEESDSASVQTRRKKLKTAAK